MNLRDETGSSTAEFAVLLPVIALVLGLVLGCGALGAQQIRVQQAAAAVARELARGSDPSVARAAGTRLAGTEASISLDNIGELNTVIVTSTVSLPLLGNLPVRGQASVAGEQ
ncbi:hypothetical protein GCM10027417_01440 [Glutamicibacter endophyticus]